MDSEIWKWGIIIVGGVIFLAMIVGFWELWLFVGICVLAAYKPLWMYVPMVLFGVYVQKDEKTVSWTDRAWKAIGVSALIVGFLWGVGHLIMKSGSSNCHTEWDGRSNPTYCD